MNGKKTLGMLSTTLLLLVMLTSVAFGANPHFIYGNASITDSGDLVVNFKIAGLGSNVETTVTASADAVAVYACRNNGGNFPADPKKEEVAGPVSESGQFTSGKNGQITGSLTVSPPATTLSCPPGQNLVLASIVYTNVKVSEPSPATKDIPGTFTKVLIELP